MINLDIDICLIVEITNDNPKYPCGLRIDCCGATKEYFLASQELRNSLVKKIGKYCIQTNFESKYILQEQIGSGNFGKVRIRVVFSDCNIPKITRRCIRQNRLRLERNLQQSASQKKILLIKRRLW